MSRRTFRLTPPHVPEHAIQHQLADVLRLEIGAAGKVSQHGVVWYAIDHANYAGEVPGVRVGRGIISGIPDLSLLYRGIGHFLEIKTTEGILSETQRSAVIAAILAAGHVSVIRDVDDLLGCLDQWAIPRLARVHYREAAIAL